MATARLMETWAHGQDIADALGVIRRRTARLRHVAHIGVRARDFAFAAARAARAGRAVPRRADRPGRALWAWGPEDAGQRVTGPALDFCLLVTQRRPPRRPGAAGHRAPTPTAGSTSPRPSPARPVTNGRRRERRTVTRPLRIGNASGFYGDRFDAVREMLTGGPLDVLTGDYLAELTMLILGRDRLKDPARGYAKTFLRQLEDCLGLAARARRADRRQRGRPQPGRTRRRRAGAGRTGSACRPRVAHVEGDDLLPAPPTWVSAAC